jgi:hypothetical protein
MKKKMRRGKLLDALKHAAAFGVGWAKPHDSHTPLSS